MSIRIKSRNKDGGRNKLYYKSYYSINKKHISELNKTRYIKIMSDRKLKIEHRIRATETTRRYRVRHPDRVRIARRKQYLTRKIKSLNLLGGAICKKCGCDEIDYLEINHKNGGGSKEIRERLKIKNYLGLTDQVLTGKRKIEDLEVLCRVCNAADYLKRKNNKTKGRFIIKWEALTPSL